MRGELPQGSAMQDYLTSLCETKPNAATRKSSEMALEAITAVLPEMVGGSADLTGSNNTKTKSTNPLARNDYSGRYIYYGIREFGMAAAMNGMALHGGIIPYGGTFLVFSDYCRNAIRLSSIQQQRVIYVMTHDSIGLGEDGPDAVGAQLQRLSGRTTLGGTWTQGRRSPCGARCMPGHRVGGLCAARAAGVGRTQRRLTLLISVSP